MSIDIDSIYGTRAADNRLSHLLSGRHSGLSSRDRLAQTVEWIQRKIDAFDTQNYAR